MVNYGFMHPHDRLPLTQFIEITCIPGKGDILRYYFPYFIDPKVLDRKSTRLNSSHT